ncbi:hypothetical protein HanXRQr2_Chr07g0280921 [Helianthus annuus]|uniref:Uncharacterized protein n=1 Tax=Helianthus annuus TaxID=4232 RepID=A0A9K3NFB6_HELAN|nr:hypothetical protein HanXRQr2_Chr07g0280921 [Helianthus annuus]
MELEEEDDAYPSSRIINMERGLWKIRRVICIKLPIEKNRDLIQYSTTKGRFGRVHCDYTCEVSTVSTFPSWIFACLYYLL